MVLQILTNLPGLYLSLKKTFLILVSVAFGALSGTSSPANNPILSTPSPSPSASSQATIKITSTTKPVSQNSSSLNDFAYPGAKTDDVDKITDWYKEKIKSGGYNVKSFVATKTNGEVLNKLVGANAQSKVSITISKKPGAEATEISVVLE